MSPRKTFTHIIDAGQEVKVNEQFPDLPTFELNGRRFYTAPNGRKLPSVTTVLDYGDKPHLEKWKQRIGETEAQRQLAWASKRGHEFHSIVESYVNNDETYLVKLPNASLKTTQLWVDAKKKIDENIDQVILSEKCLYNYHMGIAGRVDLVAFYDRVPSIIDFKTSTNSKREEWIQNYFEQAATYMDMFNAQRPGGSRWFDIDQIVVFIISEHENIPQVFIKRDHAEIHKYQESFKDKLNTFQMRP